MSSQPGDLPAARAAQQPTYWQRLALVAYLSLLVYLPAAYAFLLGKLLLTNSLFFSPSAQSVRYIDFDLFYMAGKMMLTNHHHAIYDPAVQLATFNSLYPLKLPSALFAQYPPYSFILLAPMSSLPMPWAFTAWSLLAVLAAGGGFMAVALAWRKGFSKAQIAILMVGIAASLPTWTNLRDGGSMPYIAGCIGLFILGWKNHRDLICGAALALATTFKPQHCPFLAAAAVASRRWKLLSCAIVAELVLLLLAGATVGWQNVWSYPSVLANVETSKTLLGVLPEIMINSRGLVSGLLPAPLTAWVVALAFVSGIVYCVWVWICAQARNEELTRWAISLTLLTGLLAGPHVHLHDCLLLGFVAILTLPSLNPFAVVRQCSPAVKTWCLILLFYPLIGFATFIGWELWPPLMLNNSLFALLNLVLLSCGTVHYRHLLKNCEYHSAAEQT